MFCSKMASSLVLFRRLFVDDGSPADSCFPRFYLQSRHHLFHRRPVCTDGVSRLLLFFFSTLTPVLAGFMVVVMITEDFFGVILISTSFSWSPIKISSLRCRQTWHLFFDSLSHLTSSTLVDSRHQNHFY